MATEYVACVDVQTTRSSLQLFNTQELQAAPLPKEESCCSSIVAHTPGLFASHIHPQQNGQHVCCVRSVRVCMQKSASSSLPAARVCCRLPLTFRRRPIALYNRRVMRGSSCMSTPVALAMPDVVQYCMPIALCCIPTVIHYLPDVACCCLTLGISGLLGNGNFLHITALS